MPGLTCSPLILHYSACQVKEKQKPLVSEVPPLCQLLFNQPCKCSWTLINPQLDAFTPPPAPKLLINVRLFTNLYCSFAGTWQSLSTAEKPIRPLFSLSALTSRKKKQIWQWGEITSVFFFFFLFSNANELARRMCKNQVWAASFSFCHKPLTRISKETAVGES